MNTLNNNNKSAKRPDLPARARGLTREILRAWLPAALLWILIIAIALALIGCEGSPAAERGVDQNSYDWQLVPDRLRVRDDAGRDPDDEFLADVLMQWANVIFCLQIHGHVEPGAYPSGEVLVILEPERLASVDGSGTVDGIFWWPELVIQWHVYGLSKYRTLRHEFVHFWLYVGGGGSWGHDHPGFADCS